VNFVPNPFVSIENRAAKWSRNGLAYSEVAVMIPRALRETQTKQDHATLVGNIFRGAFVWLLVVGVVGLP